MLTVQATVTYQDLEGGFWGLIDDDGRAFRPVDPLPEWAQKDGCRVEADLVPVAVISFTMWGDSVQVADLRPC